MPVLLDKRKSKKGIDLFTFSCRPVCKKDPFCNPIKMLDIPKAYKSFTLQDF